MESWGWTVVYISANASQAEFDTMAALAAVAYICEDVDSSDLTTKLRDSPIGVVNEEVNLIDDFKLGNGFGFPAWTDTLNITNNTHEITEACIGIAESHAQGGIWLDLPLANRDLYVFHV